jgi:leucyl-tRNA synthetase
MSQMISYDPAQLQEKYRVLWNELGVYEPDMEQATRPYYNLMMFPYPSAEGLHVGNMYAFTGADVHGRFRRMQGFDVFEPIGLDGFGIHSENYAIKIGKHPAEQAKISQENFYRQLQMIGNGFAWNHRMETYDPEYYRWTQWLFAEMFRRGLAYQAEAAVNWCPSCKTVLADEQVEDGRCERCKSEVERRQMKSWYLKITDYADRLLDNIDSYQWTDAHGEKHTGLQWPKKVTIAQKNWIGRKTGINIEYEIVGSDKTVTCFTTTPVNFGATFLVIAPEHPLLDEVILSPEHRHQVEAYRQEAMGKSEQARQEGVRDKTGVFTGLYVKNHVTSEQIPLWVSDFVLMNFGTGVVQGCPGHDLRDFDFATKFGISIRRVVIGEDGDTTPIERREQVIEAGAKGVMVNSDFLDGMTFAEAMKKTMDHFVEQGWGKRVENYHLRDWLISRQRYWGPPIPLMHCDACAMAGKGERAEMPGWYSVPDKDLPVELPFIEEFKPQGDGTSPLDNAPDSWKYPVCPGCGGQAERETDVSDTFLDSSWYFLRYPVLKNAKASEHPFPQIGTDHPWFPVDAYIGGAEHAVLHLLYSRFVTMALHDWGFLEIDEPFPYLFGHGLIIKDGAKMSKSKGNVVNPDEYIQKYGADALRSYLMFIGPYDQGGDFRDTGMHAMHKWLVRVWEKAGAVDAGSQTSPEMEVQLHQVIQANTGDMDQLKFNTCLARLMEIMNAWKAGGSLSAQDTVMFLQLLAPFAPYISEELFQSLKLLVSGLADQASIHTLRWPEADPKKAQRVQVTIAVQVNGKLRATLEVSQDIARDQVALEEQALVLEVVQKNIGENSVRKVIFVPGKILNFVL